MKVQPGKRYWDGNTALSYRYDDGGRSAAGFKGSAGDHVARAIAIASGRPYAQVYADLAAGNNPPRGKWFRDYMASLGATWTPTRQGRTVRLLQGELPAGRLVVVLSRRYTAVIDGTIHDTVNPTRTDIRIEDLEQRLVHRCVHGYWTFPARRPGTARRRCRGGDATLTKVPS